MKKLLALLLALMMIISLGCVSFSAQEDIYESENPVEDWFLSEEDMLDDEEIQATLDEFVVDRMGGVNYLEGCPLIKKYTFESYGGYFSSSGGNYEVFDLNFTYDKEYEEYFGTASVKIGDRVYSNEVFTDVAHYLGLGYYVVMIDTGEVMLLEDAIERGLPEIEEICEGPGFSRMIGDLDNDRQITVKDATYTQKLVAGLVNENFYGLGTFITGVYLSIYDFDGNGDIDVRDATSIQKYLAGLPFNFEGNVNVTSKVIPETAQKIDCNIKTGYEVWDYERFYELMDNAELFTSADEYAAVNLGEEDIYNEEYFENNNLIFVHRFNSSGTFGYKVRGLYAEGDTLYVDTCFLDVTPGMGVTDDENAYGIYMEFPKSAAPEGVKVVKFMDVKYFPSQGEDIKDYH